MVNVPPFYLYLAIIVSIITTGVVNALVDATPISGPACV